MEDRSAWLRDARGRSGLTQRALAGLAKVTPRTIQRAETGEKMSLRVWKALEASLGSSPMIARRRASEGETSAFFRKTFKALRRLRTAKELLDAMTITSHSKLDYDVEPNAEIVPVLREVIQWLETRLPDAWNVDRRRYRPSSVLERLEDETALNGLIDRLQEIGASIYWEHYWEDIIYPQEAAGFDGHLYVDKDLKSEGRFLMQVVISASLKDRDTFPEVMNWGVEIVEDDDDSDVPF
jgi:transcriptional regulator with XRE-family HTH domain